MRHLQPWKCKSDIMIVPFRKVMLNTSVCSHRNRPTTAQKLYSNLPAHYVDMRWVKIESSLLTQCTRLQGQLDMSRERLLSTLALLRSGVEFRSNSWRLETAEAVDTGSGDSSVELAKKLMDDVYQLSGTLTKGQHVSI